MITKKFWARIITLVITANFLINSVSFAGGFCLSNSSLIPESRIGASRDERIERALRDSFTRRATGAAYTAASGPQPAVIKGPDFIIFNPALGKGLTTLPVPIIDTLAQDCTILSVRDVRYFNRALRGGKVTPQDVQTALEIAKKDGLPPIRILRVSQRDHMPVTLAGEVCSMARILSTTTLKVSEMAKGLAANELGIDPADTKTEDKAWTKLSPEKQEGFVDEVADVLVLHRDLPEEAQKQITGRLLLEAYQIVGNMPELSEILDFVVEAVEAGDIRSKRGFPYYKGVT